MYRACIQSFISHLSHDVIVGQHCDDSGGRGRDLGGAGGRRRPGGHGRVQTGLVHVEGDDLLALLQQVLGHPVAHVAEADEAHRAVLRGG